MDLPGAERLYRAYNTLMWWSVELDDRGWVWGLPK
jgi:hypothetical protein